MRSFLVVLVFLTSGVFGQTPVSKSSPASVDRARSIIDDSLKDKNPDTRKHAVQALSLISPREPYLSQLEVMLDDKDVEVRLATITSLVDLQSKRTIVTLQKALDSDVPEVSFAAAKALWTLNEPAGREALISVLSGETKTSSGFITKQKRDALRMLHTPKTMFLFALRQGANFAPVPGLGAGVSSLQGILSDPSVSGRAATALLLSSDPSPEVLQALQDALADADWSVRAAAVHSIALRNDPAMTAELGPLLDDKKEAVRVRAAAGYLRLEAIESTRGKTVTRRSAAAKK
ncbi:MAG: lyase domain protein repeat-containing protein [Bryobacterales bacterium]|nr:lyase domain protein repeat-containing protein [Bryobacterales bacterium]